tara:strand:- start:421 stop:597 length:177 start_codon:yes stop_codon:yes gene_type:complete
VVAAAHQSIMALVELVDQVVVGLVVLVLVAVHLALQHQVLPILGAEVVPSIAQTPAVM